MYEETLMNLGLSQNEAKVYLSLLEISQNTVTHIADHSKLHRANVYESLNRLVEKGLVTYIEKKRAKYYEAAEPNALMRILKDKENMLQSILPQLNMIQKLSSSKGQAHIFEGIPAFVNLLYGFLKYKKPIFAYGIPKSAPEMMKTRIPHFHKERLEKGIAMKHIYNHKALKRIKFLNGMKNTEAKYLPKKFDSLVSTNICGDEVVITLWRKPVTSIQIKNKLVAESYRNYFNLLWNSAKST